jgi:hypothetical protein
MILQLTYNQAEALKYLFEKQVNPELPEDVTESLVKDLLRQVYRKLCSKLGARKKNGYNLILNDMEAKAFYLYFQDRLLGPHWLYEQTLIDALVAPLEKEYA